MADVQPIRHALSQIRKPSNRRPEQKGDFVTTAMDELSILDQGFEVVRNIVAAAELDIVSQQLQDIHSAGTRCMLEHAWCRLVAVAVRTRLAAAHSECESLKIVQATYFNKNPQTNWLVALHQDRSIPVAADTPRSFPGWSQKEGLTFVQPPDAVLQTLVAVRLHVDDSNPDNGPLRVIPNSHRDGTLSPDQIAALRERFPEIELTANRGDVIAMRPLLLHASSKSRSEKPRRVIHFLCGPEKLPDGLRWNTIV